MLSRFRGLSYLGLCLFLLSTACTNDEKTPRGKTLEPQESPITIEITSHTDGQKIFGSRAVTFAGTISSTTAVSAVTVSYANVTAPVTFDQTTFSAKLTLTDRGNKILVTAANAAGGTTTATLNLHFPFLRFTDGQDASLVIGAPDFTTDDGGVEATDISAPWGNPAFTGKYLYLPDFGNNRVLGFHDFPAQNGAAADFVLGQPDFATTTGGTDRGIFKKTASVATANGRLAIGMQDNRVLLYLSLPTSTGALADVVIGQPDFTSNTPTCTATGLNRPNSVVLLGDKMIITDTANHRVLIWNSIPGNNGAPASLVLGQPNFDTCTSDTTASSMSSPYGVWSDGERIIVADSDNYRVLVWNTWPTTNGQAADVVIGQPNLTTQEWQTPSQSVFYWPGFVSSNGNQIFIADCGHRVMIWDAFPTTNGTPADRLLGQAAYDQEDSTTTAATTNCPAGLELIGTDGLLVGDSGNARFLLFKVQ